MKDFSPWCSLTTGYTPATLHPHGEVTVQGMRKTLERGCHFFSVVKQFFSAKAIRFLTCTLLASISSHLLSHLGQSREAKSLSKLIYKTKAD